MSNTNRSKVCRAGSALLVLLTLAPAATPSHALPAEPARALESPQLRCRRAIEFGYRRWLGATLKSREKCQRDILSGLAPAATDCISGDASGDLSSRLARAGQQLRQRLASACEGVNWGLLSYPGPCGDVAVFDSEALSACIENFAERRTAEFFSKWYPAGLGYERGARRQCLRAVPRRAAVMVLKEIDARLACLLQQESDGADPSIDCRAQLAPDGPGTADPALDKKIRRSQRTWLRGVPRSCFAVNYDELGYGSACTNPTVSASDAFGFRACVYRDNRLAVLALLDLAFPSAPVCGNGILQEGEVCDDGAANSDTQSDACRLDCTLPRCGDGATDHGRGEQCDDGNTADLDRCNASCKLEFCGDGILNDQPGEQCDDSNTDAHDLCTDTCKVARCGDAVVCSDASCTSGPGGGPEICDRGAANAADGICKSDCSGFSLTCTLTVGVTNSNSAKLGALTYELSYKDADGEFPGAGGTVQCTSPVSGGLVSFFDNESRRAVKESLIVSAGLKTPASLAQCSYVTNDAGLSASDFGFSVLAASDTDFNVIPVSLAVTGLDCTA